LRFANRSDGAKSDAAFGAALYRNFVLVGAIECNLDKESKSFILLSLGGSVQVSAAGCFEVRNRT
jgi:hypothetical protein